MLNARPLPAVLLSHGRDRTALTDEPTGQRWDVDKTALSYSRVRGGAGRYVVLRCLQILLGGSAQMSDDHPDDDGIDDQYNNPEFDWKLRQGAALEKS